MWTIKMKFPGGEEEVVEVSGLDVAEAMQNALIEFGVGDNDEAAGQTFAISGEAG